MKILLSDINCHDVESINRNHSSFLRMTQVRFNGGNYQIGHIFMNKTVTHICIYICV